MKKIFPIALLAITAFLSSCTTDDIIPNTPLSPATDRKLCFHCDKHNLSYRFSKYILSEYKDYVMPCPVCDTETAYAWMKANELYDYQLLCPIDSTWSNFGSTDTFYSSSKFFVTRQRIPFFPIVPSIESFKGFSIDYLVIQPLNRENKDYVHFPDCWCDACYSKARTAAVVSKKDSVAQYHGMINKIVGIDPMLYPLNNGFPVDRRIRATEILDSIERIMPTLDRFYKKEYNTINYFVGGFNAYRQRYIYSQKTCTPIGSWVDEDIAYCKVSSDAYIGDTVVINIGGGPDYWMGGGMCIPLYKAKPNATKAHSTVKAFQTTTKEKNLQHSVKKRNIAPYSPGSKQLTTNFIPGKIDFLPSEYLPRKYNTSTTSVFTISHPQQGNEFISDNVTRGTWTFLDLGKSVGGWDTKFPNNIVSVETAELLNDVGVMQIRKVVEWCKARNKKIVIMGTSWGGAMIMRYLLYYPTSDFDFIMIADQNPNMPKSIIENELENYIYGPQAQKTGATSFKEINPNMCVISTDVYRRMNWLKNQNLSNTVFYFSQSDTNVGTIPSEDISTLKSQGAKIYSFPHPIAHGVFHDARAWSRQVTPTQM